MTTLSNSDLKILILRTFAKSSQTKAKYNVLGKPGGAGDLEIESGVSIYSA
jgi:hypothetical protein